MRIVDINDSTGSIVAEDWLKKAEATHRQLRPKLPSAYTDKMRSVFAGGGRMCVAVVDDLVVGVGVYRIYDNTFSGLHMYVDDLVTDESQRSTGVGKALLNHLQGIARDAACTTFELDSGTQRQQAHKFYFREGMVVTSFHFRKTLV